MKQKGKLEKKVVGLLLTLVMISGLVPGMGLTVYATPTIRVITVPEEGGNVLRTQRGNGEWIFTPIPKEGYVFENWEYTTGNGSQKSNDPDLKVNLNDVTSETVIITAFFAPQNPAGGNKTEAKDDDKTETKEDDDDDDDDDNHTTVINPDSITAAFNVNGIFATNMKAGKQAQGPMGAMLFKLGTPAGWQEAFSFNMSINDKTDYTLKKGIMTFYVPEQYLKTNRQYAILAIDKNGQVHMFADTDHIPNSVTVNLNVEGYAFDLIYKD